MFDTPDHHTTANATTTRHLGCYPSRGLLRQCGGTGTVSANRFKIRWSRRRGTVGALDGTSLGAVGVHHGPSSIFAEDGTGSVGHFVSLSAHSRQGCQGGSKVCVARYENMVYGITSDWIRRAELLHSRCQNAHGVRGL